MYSRKIAKIIMCGVIATQSLLVVDIQAQVNNKTSYQKVYNNFTDLGVLKEYTINSNETPYVSRDYGKAQKMFKGEKITKDGTYILRFKDSDKIVRFEIEDSIDYVASNDEELKEIIREALDTMQKTITIELKNGYFSKSSKNGDKLSKLINGVLYEYPLLMYDSGSFSQTDNKLKINFEYSMNDGDYFYITEKIENGIKSYINGLDLTLSDIELQKRVVYDILDHVEYDEYSRSVEDVPLSHHIQGLSNGNRLVCDGYARVFMSLANTLGIPTQIISGTAGGEGHAWNIVNHNGQYYHVDLTWADSEHRVTDYVNYVNEKDSYMQETHTWDRSKYPECIANDYINTTIYDCIDIEDFNKSKSIDTSKSIVTDIGDESALTDIVSKYGRSIKYVKYNKYGKSIITVTE